MLHARYLNSTVTLFRKSKQNPLHAGGADKTEAWATQFTDLKILVAIRFLIYFRRIEEYKKHNPRNPQRVELLNGGIPG